MAAKDIEAAVKAWQLVAGCGGRARLKDEQRLYNRARAKTRAVAKRRGMDEFEAERQITAEARRRGGICPMPGKDL